MYSYDQKQTNKSLPVKNSFLKVPLSTPASPIKEALRGSLGEDFFQASLKHLISGNANTEDAGFIHLFREAFDDISNALYYWEKKKETHSLEHFILLV